MLHLIDRDGESRARLAAGVAEPLGVGNLTHTRLKLIKAIDQGFGLNHPPLVLVAKELGRATVELHWIGRGETVVQFLDLIEFHQRRLHQPCRNPAQTFSRTARQGPVEERNYREHDESLYHFTGRLAMDRSHGLREKVGNEVAGETSAPRSLLHRASVFRAASSVFSPAMDPKQRAAEAAIQFVQNGMVIGLGTGSTADQFLQALSASLKSGRLRDVRGVPTSRHSELRAAQLGIPMVSLPDYPRPDVTIDGADEVAPNLDLIKGLGGALLREKVLAQNSAKLIIIADSSKSVARLGAKSMLPVEVVPFAHEIHEPFLRTLGAAPNLRKDPSGSPFVTDNGNYIYDCRFPNGIDKPHELDAALRSRAGIVETGLFLGMASIALIADENRVRELRRE